MYLLYLKKNSCGSVVKIVDLRPASLGSIPTGVIGGGAKGIRPKLLTCTSINHTLVPLYLFGHVPAVEEGINDIIFGSSEDFAVI